MTAAAGRPGRGAVRSRRSTWPKASVPIPACPVPQAHVHSDQPSFDRSSRSPARRRRSTGRSGSWPRSASVSRASARSSRPRTSRRLAGERSRGARRDRGGLAARVEPPHRRSGPRRRRHRPRRGSAPAASRSSCSTRTAVAGTSSSSGAGWRPSRERRRSPVRSVRTRCRPRSPPATHARGPPSRRTGRASSRSTMPWRRCVRPRSSSWTGPSRCRWPTDLPQGWSSSTPSRPSPRCRATTCCRPSAGTCWRSSGAPRRRERSWSGRPS
jgi:hypothetical protein